MISRARTYLRMRGILKESMHAKGPLEIIACVSDESKESLARLIDEHATIRHVHEHAGIVSFTADPAFTQDLAKAALGYTTLATSHPTATRGLESLEKAARYSIPHMRVLGRQSDQSQWNLEMIGAPRANLHSEGEGVAIAVLDTGIDYHHNEIKKRFGQILGVDLVAEADPIDRNGHGTHVAGTIAGKTTGVAPKAHLYAVKVLDDDGSGLESTVIAGIDWCIGKDIPIINMSLGSSRRSRAFEMTIESAYQQGLSLVAAAGNSGRGPSYPASYKHVIGVAAVDKNKRHAPFSNIYKTNDISAPGVDVHSTIPGDRYADYSGTSMATPHIAGVLALAQSAAGRKDYTSELRRHAERLEELPGEEYRDVYGAGLVRADSLLEHVSSAPYMMIRTAKNAGKALWRVLI